MQLLKKKCTPYKEKTAPKKEMLLFKKKRNAIPQKETRLLKNYSDSNYL